MLAALAGPAAAVLSRAEPLAHITKQQAAQRALADLLQRALLAPPPEPDHLHLVSRYSLAARRSQVGGDWYDAFLLPTAPPLALRQQPTPAAAAA